jgi:hypothetical protein
VNSNKIAVTTATAFNEPTAKPSQIHENASFCLCDGLNPEYDDEPIQIEKVNSLYFSANDIFLFFQVVCILKAVSKPLAPIQIGSFILQ